VLAALFDSISFIGEAANGNGGILQRVLSDFHVEWPLITAQTLNFCVVAYLLYRFAFKPLFAVIDERQRKITDGLQYAEEMHRQLGLVEMSRDKTLKEAASEAREIIAAARENAEIIHRHEQEKLNCEIEIGRERERERIQRERVVVLAELQRNGAQLVAKLAQKVFAAPNYASERKAFTQRACEEIAP
jgi:F-type H+-transporting ATPase subunit b